MVTEHEKAREPGRESGSRRLVRSLWQWFRQEVKVAKAKGEVVKRLDWGLPLKRELTGFANVQ